MFKTITICGRLVHTIEAKASNNGKKYASFTLATNRGETAEYWDVVAFGKAADTAALYGKRGRMMIVTGEPEQERYTGRDGQKRTAYKIVCERFRFIGKAPEDEPAETEQDTPEAADGGTYEREEYYTNDLPF